MVTCGVNKFGWAHLKLTLVDERGEEIRTLLDVPVTDVLSGRVSDASIGPETATAKPGSVGKKIIWDELEKAYPESNLFDPNCKTDLELDEAMRPYLKEEGEAGEFEGHET